VARPRGSKNKPKTPPPEGDATGHNANGGLTDSQRQALFFQHLRKYKAALAAKKQTDAAFRNCCKLAKAELGDHAIDEVKDAILLEEDGGEAELQARIERQIRIARWLNLPLGAQTDLFDTVDRRPATERAFEEGKISGMKGETLNSPHAPGPSGLHDAFIEGWHAGQKEAFNIQRTQDGALFEEPPEGEALGDQPATFVEA